MSFATGTDDRDLGRRLDELEARLEFLERLVIDATEEAGPAAEGMLETAVVSPDTGANGPVTASTPPELAPPESVPPGLVPSSEPALEPTDLRKLQAQATADLSFVRPEPLPEPRSAIGDLRDIEERLAGRALAVVGGAALLLGAVFFLSLAFSRGWIGPEMQVALGLAGGSLGLAVGAFLLSRGERIVGHVLTAVGLAVISLSLFAATSLYGLAEPPVALLGVFVAAVIATVIAVRSRSQVVAGFGLVAALAAPPLMGAAPDLLAVAYMAVVLVGIAAVSLWQTWPWLPPVAFVLSAPQLYTWIVSEPEPTQAVPAILGYWAVLAVAAGGEAFRGARPVLSITSAPLFLVDGAAAIGLSFMVLGADPERAAFLLTLAALHGLVAAFFAVRRGLLDPFGLLAGAYGIAIASAAVPLLLDAPATAVVWTAEAGTLAVLAGRRAHGPALIASTILFAAASARLAYEALLFSPFADARGLEAPSGSVEGAVASFVFLLAAVAMAMGTVPVRPFRLYVIGLLALVAVSLVSALVEDAAAVAAWMLIAVVAVGTLRWVGYLPERRIRWQLGPALRWIRPVEDVTPFASMVPLSAAAAAVVLALANTIEPVITHYGLPSVPFTDQAGLATLALAGGFVAIGVVAGGAASLRRALLAAGLAIGVVSIIEFAAPWYVLVWAGLAVGAAAKSRSDDGGFFSYQRMAFGALAMLALLALIEAPPVRLMVRFGGVPSHPFLLSDATVALGALAVALVMVAFLADRHWPRTIVVGLVALAGGTALYLLSVGIVDVFASEAHELRVIHPERLAELIKEAQVALSILWTVVGVAVLGAGLLLRRAELRFAGLAVLGLATVKVFLVDLSALDVAYRVVTLIFLGLLLIVSAYAWSRMKPTDRSGHDGRQEPADATARDARARP